MRKIPFSFVMLAVLCFLAVSVAAVPGFELAERGAWEGLRAEYDAASVTCDQARQEAANEGWWSAFMRSIGFLPSPDTVCVDAFENVTALRLRLRADYLSAASAQDTGIDVPVLSSITAHNFSIRNVDVMTWEPQCEQVASSYIDNTTGENTSTTTWSGCEVKTGTREDVVTTSVKVWQEIQTTHKTYCVDPELWCYTDADGIVCKSTTHSDGLQHTPFITPGAYERITFADEVPSYELHNNVAGQTYTMPELYECAVLPEVLQ